MTCMFRMFNTVLDSFVIYELYEQVWYHFLVYCTIIRRSKKSNDQMWKKIRVAQLCWKKTLSQVTWLVLTNYSAQFQHRYTTLKFVTNIGSRGWSIWNRSSFKVFKVNVKNILKCSIFIGCFCVQISFWKLVTMCRVSLVEKEEI